MKRSNGHPDDGPAPKFRREDDPTKVLRVLIPSRAAGPIIGKGGDTIKELRTQYSVRLHIPVCRGPERVFYMEGERANVVGCLRHLNDVLLDVLSAKNADQRLLEGRKDDDGNDLDPAKLLDLRILMHHSQVGSVIGKGGDRVKELREKHRMPIIKIYQEFAPRSTDRVLQLIGEPQNVYDCVDEIIETLEATPPRGNRSDYDANNFDAGQMPDYYPDPYMGPPMPPSMYPQPYGYDVPYPMPPPLRRNYAPPLRGPYDDRPRYPGNRSFSRSRQPPSPPPSSGYSSRDFGPQGDVPNPPPGY